MLYRIRPSVLLWKWQPSHWFVFVVTVIHFYSLEKHTPLLYAVYSQCVVAAEYTKWGLWWWHNPILCARLASFFRSVVFAWSANVSMNNFTSILSSYVSDLCSQACLSAVPLSSTTPGGDSLRVYEIPLLLHNLIPRPQNPPFSSWLSSDEWEK